MKYRKQEILKMRKEFFAAYEKSTGKKPPKDLKEHKSDEYYDPIRNEIKRRLGLEKSQTRIVENQTFRRLLFDDVNFNFFPVNFNLLKKYIDTVREEFFVNKNENKTFFIGSLIIDKDFADKIKTLNPNFIPSEFYVAKQKSYCQWYGILKEDGWDQKRKDYDKIKSIICESFNEKITDFNVSAVIHGKSGTGKSTLLRRLAIDFLTEEFAVLWITNLRLFEKNLGVIEYDLFNKYLLIVDDWEKTKIDESTAISFINQIANLNNVRVVIGDENIENKSYLKHVNDKSIFQLFTTENRIILEKVSQVNPKWSNTINNILEKSDFLDNSIYIILFVVYNTDLNGLDWINPANILLQFKNIISNDQEYLYDLNPGAAKALYFFSCLYKKHGALFTWKDFVVLANSYNKKLKINLRLRDFDIDKPDCKVLSRYIYFDSFVIPFLQSEKICKYHHDLLPIEGLSNPIQGQIIFDNDSIWEHFKILHWRRRKFIAFELYLILKSQNAKISKLRMFCYGLFYINTVFQFSTITQFNELLKSFYDQSNKLKDELEWEINLMWIFLFFDSYGPYTDIKIVLENLVNNGCTSQSVHKYKKMLTHAFIFYFTFENILIDLIFKHNDKDRTDIKVFQDILTEQTVIADFWNDRGNFAKKD